MVFSESFFTKFAYSLNCDVYNDNLRDVLLRKKCILLGIA